MGQGRSDAISCDKHVQYLMISSAVGILALKPRQLKVLSITCVSLEKLESCLDAALFIFYLALS